MHSPRDNYRHSRRDGAGGGRGAGGKRSRLFDHGDLRLAALRLIAEKPRHGYEIIKEIGDRSGGAYAPSPGAIYPTLTLLEELGQLTVVETADMRKRYSITDAGLAELTAKAKIVDAIFARLEQADVGEEQIAPVRLAIQDLKHALRKRMAQDALDATELADIVEKIKEVTAFIAGD